MVQIIGKLCNICTVVVKQMVQVIGKLYISCAVVVEHANATNNR